MNWDDLRILLAIARERTLSGAAPTLGVAHTTVSRRLQALEEELGVRVFDRKSDGLHPTSAGLELLGVAERMESEVLLAEGRVVGRDVELRGPLRVSTLDFLFAASRSAFASFVRRYPSIDLTVTSSMDPVSLAHREADVALRLSLSPPDSLVGRRVARVPYAAYASPELVEGIGKNADLSEFPWIGIDERGDNKWFERWLATNAPRARIAVRTDANTLLRQQMVLAGVGVTLLTVWEAESLGLCRVGPILRSPVAHVWLLTHPDLKNSARVRAFLDHMGAELPKVAAWSSRC